MSAARKVLIIVVVWVSLALLAACGEQPAATAPAVATATVSADTPVAQRSVALAPTATATLMSAATVAQADASPTAALATVTMAPTAVVAATPVAAGPRPTATDEPEDCLRSVGTVYGWYDAALNYKPEDLAQHTAALKSACAEDRWLAIWLLGTVHEAAALPALNEYIAAHRNGDWLRDQFDIVPVARAAVAYIGAPLDPQRSYAVQELELYDQPRREAVGASAPGQKRIVAAGGELQLLGAVKTDQTVPDHGGDTPVIFERVRVPGDTQDHFVDISPYVASYPRYFALPANTLQ